MAGKAWESNVHCRAEFCYFANYWPNFLRAVEHIRAHFILPEHSAQRRFDQLFFYSLQPDQLSRTLRIA
jgi:hypothetical protein